MGSPNACRSLVRAKGWRCLDIGTYDGFWAFEMERRGASEVIALDVVDVEQWDWPLPGRKQTLLDWKQGIPSYTGFDVAHRALSSRVERIELSVYEATPEKLGMFDFILFGDLLPHLRDPVGALTAIRSVCRGQLLSADVVSLTMTLLRPFHPAADLEALRAPFWWTPNVAARKRMLSAAGYDLLRTGPYLVPRGEGAPPPRRSPRAQFLHRLGLPHLWVLAAPTP